MKGINTPLDGVVIVEPVVFGDDRGYFFEAWNSRRFAEATGYDGPFVQDNQSRSQRGVLRGLHYQQPTAQGKFVRVIAGAIWDVAVDLRRSSPTFGEWFGLELNAEDKRGLWLPIGFGHGFVVLSDVAEVLYKATDYYDPDADRGIRWDDPDLAIDWPVENPILSAKDAVLPPFSEAVVFD